MTQNCFAQNNCVGNAFSRNNNKKIKKLGGELKVSDLQNNNKKNAVFWEKTKLFSDFCLKKSAADQKM